MTQDDDPSEEDMDLLRRLLARRRAGAFISQEEGRAQTLAMIERYRGRLQEGDRLSRNEANKR